MLSRSRWIHKGHSAFVSSACNHTPLPKNSRSFHGSALFEKEMVSNKVFDCEMRAIKRR